MSATHVVDANTWIALYEEKYPQDVFPGLYSHIASVAEKGRIKTPHAVLRELGDQKKGVGGWIRGLSIVAPVTPRIRHLAATIHSTYPNLVKPTAAESADPWLIAFAEECGWVVVTDETPARNAAIPKIPDVCAARGVTCIGTIEFMRAIGVRL